MKQDDPYQEKILTQEVDAKGRLIKKVITGYIPGEDVFLTIAKYDTAGNVVEAYGAAPYENKYRTKFRYDTSGNLVEELKFKFKSRVFENFAEERYYTLEDTAVSYEGTVEFRTLYYYDLRDSIVFEYHYYAEYDSASGQNVYSLSKIDTTDMKAYEYQQLDYSSYYR